MPSTQDLRDEVARHLRDTLNERTRAKTDAQGYAGPVEIRELAAALRHLDAALTLEITLRRVIERGLPLFGLTRLDAAAAAAREDVVDEARHRG